jgi:hypothetical protein
MIWETWGEKAFAHWKVTGLKVTESLGLSRFNAADGLDVY